MIAWSIFNVPVRGFLSSLVVPNPDASEFAHEIPTSAIGQPDALILLVRKTFAGSRRSAAIAVRQL